MSRLSARATQAEDPQISPMDGFALAAMPGHLIRRVQQVAVRLFAENVGSDFTPVQYAALAALSQNAGIGQAALAATIGYDRATIGGVIDRLESRGLVKRIQDRNDRRSNCVSLTAEGLAAFEQERRHVQQVQELLLEALSPVEKQAFETICLKILRHHGG